MLKNIINIFEDNALCIFVLFIYLHFWVYCIDCCKYIVILADIAASHRYKIMRTLKIMG